MRLLSKSFALLEEHCQHNLAILSQAHHRIAALRKTSIFDKWRDITGALRNLRCAKEEKAEVHGERLFLMRAMQGWRKGVKVCREEREIDLKVEAKWLQVNRWLEQGLYT